MKHGLIRKLTRRGKVTPCVGVWIETIQVLDSIYLEIVTPCVGVWIETYHQKRDQNLDKSHPAWVCGLKQSSIRNRR